MNYLNLVNFEASGDGFCEAVEHRLRTLLARALPPADAPDASLSMAAEHLALAPGAKRARPRLVRLFGAILGVESAALTDLAAAAELIHTASLLHDDVVDCSPERRGRPSANALWGNANAILSGDLMLSTAIQQLRGFTPEVTTIAVEVVAQMSRAALMELRARWDVGTDVERCCEIARGKTGALFGWCGQAVALAFGDDEAAACFERCGRRFGLAFQRADDLLDGADLDAGKPRWADIRNGGPSYLISVALQTDPSLRGRFDEIWSQRCPTERQVQALGSAVNSSGAVAITRQSLLDEIAGALDELGPYRSHPAVAELQRWMRARVRKLGGASGRQPMEICASRRPSA